jgi:hypothetical protein
MGIFDILFCVRDHIKELDGFHNSVHVSIYGDDAIGELHQNFGAVLVIPLTETVNPAPSIDCASIDKLQFAVAVGTYHGDQHAVQASGIQEIGVMAADIIKHMQKFKTPVGVKKISRLSPLRIEGLNGWLLYPLIYEAELVV